MKPSMYEAAGGSAGMSALAHAWHRRCLLDPLASHPFEHAEHPDFSDRLAAYLGEALGGPPVYTASMGDHSKVLRMHSGQGNHPELDQRAVELFAVAMDDAHVPDEPGLRAGLLEFFRWATGLMAQYPDTADDVPPDLPLPHWSWDGRTD